MTRPVPPEAPAAAPAIRPTRRLPGPSGRTRSPPLLRQRPPSELQARRAGAGPGTRPNLPRPPCPRPNRRPSRRQRRLLTTAAQPGIPRRRRARRLRCFPSRLWVASRQSRPSRSRPLRTPSPPNRPTSPPRRPPRRRRRRPADGRGRRADHPAPHHRAATCEAMPDRARRRSRCRRSPQAPRPPSSAPRVGPPRSAGPAALWEATIRFPSPPLRSRRHQPHRRRGLVGRPFRIEPRLHQAASAAGDSRMRWQLETGQARARCPSRAPPSTRTTLPARRVSGLGPPEAPPDVKGRPCPPSPLAPRSQGPSHWLRPRPAARPRSRPRLPTMPRAVARAEVGDVGGSSTSGS